MKRCTKCNEEKNIGEFYGGANHHADGLRSQCKKCTNVSNKIWRKNNPEKVKAINDRWVHKAIEISEKRCPRCGEIKTVEQFYKNKGRQGGIGSWCASCDNEFNPLRRNQDKSKQRVKRWRENNKEKYLQNQRNWKKNNPDKVREKNKRSNAKKMSIPGWKLSSNVSRSIRKHLASGAKAGRKWETLVGYTIEQLTKHLEKQFQPNMSWENYGKWHIDHKIPLSVHNFSSPKDIDFKRAWSLKNLQPMWAVDNIKKHAKLTKSFQPTLQI